MKKLITFSLAVIVSAMLFTTQAQTFVRLKQGTAADTLKKSTTYYIGPVNVNFNDVQVVSATVAIDSVSGKPSGTATLEQSVDGTHWNTTGSSATWNNSISTWVGADTSFILSLNPFLGAFARIKIATTDSTQKSKYWVTFKSSTTR